MDQKQHARQTKQFKDETAKHREELGRRDRATHSENKTWDYDYKTGTLKDKKK